MIDANNVRGVTPTFAEALNLILSLGGEAKEAGKVLAREHDRLYRALDYYADPEKFDTEETYVARVALRREDPRSPIPHVEV